MGGAMSGVPCVCLYGRGAGTFEVEGVAVDQQLALLRRPVQRTEALGRLLQVSWGHGSGLRWRAQVLGPLGRHERRRAGQEQQQGRQASHTQLHLGTASLGAGLRRAWGCGSTHRQDRHQGLALHCTSERHRKAITQGHGQGQGHQSALRHVDLAKRCMRALSYAIQVQDEGGPRGQGSERLPEDAVQDAHAEQAHPLRTTPFRSRCQFRNCKLYWPIAATTVLILKKTAGSYPQPPQRSKFEFCDQAEPHRMATDFKSCG